jgi:HEAT repeat protein
MAKRRFILLVLCGGAVLTCAAALRFIVRWVEEERCLRALDDPGWHTAADTLGRFQCKRAVPKLFGLLPDVNADFREDAAGKALLAIGRPSFQFAISKLRGHREFDKEKSRAMRLLHCLPSGDVSLLMTAADDPDIELRIAVARCLPPFHASPAVVATHLRLLKDRDPEVRLEAVWSLSYVKELSDAFLPALLGILEDSQQSDRLREAAGSAIGYLGPVIAVPVLNDALLHPAPLVRQTAAYALSRFEKESRVAVPRLEGLLKDRNEAVRVAALSALEKIGATMACLESVIAFLEEGKEVWTAAGVLSQLGPGAAPAVPALIRELERDPRLLTAVAEALGRIGPAARAAVPLLQRYLADKDVNGQVWAALALGRIGPEALDGGELLVELGLRDDPSGCRDALVPLGTSVIPMVTRMLQAQDIELRALAAEYLGGFGPLAREAVPALTTALADRETEVVEKAAWALGQVGPEARAGVPSLVTLLRQILDREISVDPGVIAESLGRIGVKDDPVPALLRRVALLWWGNWCNAQALLALGRLGVHDDDTVKLLRQGLLYDEFPVQYCSAQGLFDLGIRDEKAEAVLLAASHETGWRLMLLKLHAGFPGEVKRLLPQLVDWLGEEEETTIQQLARRLAELGAEARSALPALEEAKARLLEQGRYWSESPFDSGGSHLKRKYIAGALETLDAAIESISRSGASTLREP